MARQTNTETISAPLNGATEARIEINAADGTLTVSALRESPSVLAAGVLEYSTKQGPPRQDLAVKDGRAILSLAGGRARQRWVRLPWAACNGATNWSIHLNPSVPDEVTAHSDGGNLKLDLSHLSIRQASADTGGGNIDLSLPVPAGDLRAEARSGAGNVVVTVPKGVAASITASTGLGRVVIDPCFQTAGSGACQSPDYETASQRATITLRSGAGDVRVVTS